MIEKKLLNSIDTYPDFPSKGINFKDIMPVLQNPQLFRDLIKLMAKNSLWIEIDAIIAIDARGFIFGSPVAKEVKKPLILARKKNKLPGELIKANYGLEYGKDSLTIQYSSISSFVRDNTLHLYRIFII